MSKAPRLKVYGWTGFRRESPAHSPQTREIVAAKSVAEVRRITGMSRATWEHSGGETWNDDEVKSALGQPGVVLWRPLDHHPDANGWARGK